MDIVNTDLMTPHKKLTEWANEPTIADLKQNLDDADIDNAAHLDKVKTWLDARNMTGKFAIKKVKGRSSVAPKLIRKQAEWKYAALSEPFLNTPDLFQVNPRSAGDVNRANQNRMVLNKQFNTQIEKVSFIDEYVREAVDTGTVIVKVGWVSQEEEVVKEQPVYDFMPVNDPAMVEQYTQLLQLQATDTDAYMDIATDGMTQALQIFQETGTVVVPQQIGVEEIVEIVETINQPTVEVCDQRNIIIDPSCNGNLKKAQFVGERFKSSLSELKKDGRYSHLDQILVDSANPLTDSEYSENKDISSFQFMDEPRKQVVVYCYWGSWDIDNSGIAKSIVASWIGNTMIRCEENPFPDKQHPFIKAVYMPVRGSIYGEPDAELLMENQDIIGATIRGMVDLMGRSANSQIGLRRDLLDATNKLKFQRGDDYEFNTTVDPRQAIFMHTFPEIPQSAYNLITLQNTEAESLSGVKAFHSGITGQSMGNTATGVRSAMDATSKRETGNLRRLAQGIIEIGRKFISMNAEFLSEEEIVRVTNDQFIQIRRDDLAGYFDLELHISTAEEDNKKAEELAFMLQTTGPQGDPAEVRMIRAEIARLRKMPHLAKKIEEYQPQPDPLAVMEQELKIKLLEAQIAKEQALAAKHAATAELEGTRQYKEAAQGELNSAKVGTERAKTRQLASDADNKDLQYVEQELGVNQARELEKIALKSRMQMKQQPVM